MDSVRRTRATRRALITAGGAIAVVLVSNRLRNRQDESPRVGDASLWRTGTPVPHAHSETPGVAIDGKIYIAGGFEAETRLDMLDTVSGLWTQLASLPAAVHHPGIAALNRSLYLAGGYAADGHTALDAMWRFDPTGGTWEGRASLPKAKGALGLAAAEGALFAVGGAFEHLGGTASADLLRYDPALDRWESLAPLPTAREHLAVAAVSGSIYAIGGRANGDESDAKGGVNERYDLATGLWSTVTPLPVARSGLACAWNEESIIVLGGERGSTLFADVNRYDVQSASWDALPSMPTGRHGTAAAVVGNDLYAIGGSTLAGRVQNTPVVEILTLSGDTVQES